MSGGHHDSYSNREIREILDSVRTIAVVGASPKSSRPSYFVTKYLMAKGYDVIPVNPGHAGKEIAGAKVYGSLSEIDRPVDMVDVFRNSEDAFGVTKDAIEIGAKVVWMQLGVRNDEAAKLAEEAGLTVVMNRCPKIEYGRLSGEIGWTGVNSKVLSSRRPGMSGRGFQNRSLKSDS
ncbi:CoA-binding protein [Methyloligella solikamskensis]|uniref:CoA-binding protein n=1 Tax=Methyloligella solikamskensis TaxID=1177756 RepID=A0ABW3JAB8_9HYPH